MMYTGNIEWQFSYILLAIPLVIWLYYRNQKTKGAITSYVLFSHFEDNFQFNNWKTKFIKLPEYLKLLSMILLIVAIARPRKALVNQSVTGDGIDIVLSLDISASMLTQDFQPNRLEVSKRLAKEFVDKRINDRIGLVVFSGEAFTQCPLTIDHEIINDFIEAQQVGYLEDGTAIGMGLATAVNRVKDSDAKSKIIILLTDGKNNRGYIDPETAMTLAKDLGIRVYTIGVGSDAPALGPVGRSMNGELIMDYIKGEIDEVLLEKIATSTKGKFFRAKDESELANIYTTIDELEKSKIETAVLKKYKELFRIPLLFSLLFLLSSFVSGNTVFRKFPE